ncbi:helix-turn-helix domain-containing protein [Amycolatopsis sp. FDAARGOS 1241]|uniref:winged helix-turn-helix transcriptional regulator n=1 Tax=Amycolatopsis sp. FDAARGOS 1241 TaxID=2778070 RepID=UPI00194DBC8F|nr:helix-turn-helix domain-containing protein [Amycolatopsis sp. FDAARGOS 1241]QRP49327.1 helix-turn-helix transcriptional regulator [Amycolatopsis sp. FDAARGOS 1241]
MEEWTQFAGRTTQDGYEVFHTDCPARTVLDHVTSRWGVWVLIALRERELRFFELRRSIEGVSEKMLAQTLRSLVRDGLVRREVEPTTPPQVSYSLTPLGRGSAHHLSGLFTWLRDHAVDILAAQAGYDESGGRQSA